MMAVRVGSNTSGSADGVLSVLGPKHAKRKHAQVEFIPLAFSQLLTHERPVGRGKQFTRSHAGLHDERLVLPLCLQGALATELPNDVRSFGLDDKRF